jgi:NDP-sugar pyrophosphorylase family protein
MKWSYDAFISGFATSSLAPYRHLTPWELAENSLGIVEQFLENLDGGYLVSDGVAVHQSCVIEKGAVLKGPAVLGPDCFIAAGAYVRGGCWLEGGNILGPGCELKSSLIFSGTMLAHFNFVGDSILGHAVNLEAGSIVANYRNETGGAPIRIRYGNELIVTGATKFGAILGDRTKVGANAVLAPGVILAADSIIARLTLIDQSG